MKNKIAFLLLTLIVIISACKKPSNTANVDPRITANYLFKQGTYWVYSDYAGHNDSLYVSGTGSQNGYPYMRIQETVKGEYNDTIYWTNTIYMGAGPTSNQMQLWGYGYNGGNSPQVIFETDTPSIAATVAQGLIYSGIVDMSGENPYGVPGTPISFDVNYPASNMNQEQGYVTYYFYPNFGMVQREIATSPLGELWWNLIKSHIIQ